MSRRKSGKKPSLSDFSPKHVDFTDAEKLKVVEWIESRPDLDITEAFETFLDHNVKISISRDQNNGAILLTMTPKDEKSPVYGTYFMFRHTNIERGALILLYYFTEILDNGQQIDRDDTGVYDW